jgi:hypothetical protein
MLHGSAAVKRLDSRSVGILARQHVAALGTHALEILHVAAAVVVGARAFVTGDRRRASLAEVAGLDVTRYRLRG